MESIEERREKVNRRNLSILIFDLINESFHDNGMILYKKDFKKVKDECINEIERMIYNHDYPRTIFD